MSETITIYCKNNNTYKEVPIGSSLLDIYSLVGAPLRLRPMNAQVNNKTEGLTFRCWHPKDVEYVDYTQLSGMRTYVRSLCHIFSKAVNDVLPSATLNLEHPISKGYYCVIHNGKDIDEETIGKIKKRMREIIDADLPFHLKTIRTIDAAVLFRERGMNDKARLIESAGMPYTSYYELDGYINYFYGCLTPSTGYIQVFDLVPYFDGVLLRVPQRTNPTELEPVIRQDKMFQVYKEHLTLQRTVGLDNVGDLNRAIEKGRTSEVVMVSEAMQEKQVAKIAEEIAARYGKLTQEAKNLILTHRIRVEAKPLGVLKIDAGEDSIIFTFKDKPSFDPGKFFRMLQANRNMRMLGPNRLRLETYSDTAEKRGDNILRILKELK